MFFAADVLDVVEAVDVAHSGEPDFGEEVGEEHVGAWSEPRFDLGDGLPDGDELDAHAGEGGGPDGEVVESHVSGFVDEEQNLGGDGFALDVAFV